MRRWVASVARVVVAICMVITWTAETATAGARLPACPPPASHLRTGALPHRTYPLYTDTQNRWQPLATDGRNVLMGRQQEAVVRVGGPVRFAVVHLPSTRMVPLPPGAYPRKTFTDFWQIEWPWIVGIAFTSHLPAIPANWSLWAGNAETGKHFIIDSYRLHRHPVPEFFPHFSLNDARVAWELAVDRPARDTTFSAQQIAVIDLHSRKRTILTEPDATAVLGRLTMSGPRIVWERTPVATSLGRQPRTDLMLADTRTGAITQLSHNGPDGWSSLYPQVHGQYLLFEQGPADSDYGRPYLVDLGTQTDGRYKQWWRDYRFRSLGKTGGTNTQIGDGLVFWAYQGLLDVTRSQIWPLPTPDGWSVRVLAGRTAVVTRLANPNGAHMAYAAWVIPETCAPSAWLPAGS